MVRCLQPKTEIARANSTSTNASVHTLAAVAISVKTIHIQGVIFLPRAYGDAGRSAVIM